MAVNATTEALTEDPPAPSPDDGQTSLAQLVPDPPSDIGALAGSPQPTADGRTGGLDINALLQRATGPVDPALQSKFVDLKQQQLSQFQRQQDHSNRALDEDRDRMTKAFNAESATIDSTPKWDAEAEAKKHAYDPIQAFGSLGSVFAMVASAFTRAPMENALNGAAAAMNAIHAGKDQEYDRAFDSFKANVDLAVKRFNMQHTALNDAHAIMQVDAQRGQQAMLQTLTKFGMEKELLLYNNGMIPEIQQIQDSQLKAIEGVVRAKNEMERMDEQRRHNKVNEDLAQQREDTRANRPTMTPRIKAELEQNPDFKGADVEKRADVFLKALGLEGDEAARESLKQILANNAQATPEELNDAVQRAPAPRNMKALEAQEVNRRVQEYVADGMSQSDAFNKARKEVAQAGSNSRATEAGSREAEAQKRYEEALKKLDPAAPNFDKKRAEAWTVAHQEVKKSTQNAKTFTAPEQKQLEVMPLLARNLQVLDQFANGTLGFMKGPLIQVGAEYGGLNDAAQIYHAAHAAAEKNIAELGASGRVSVAGMKKALETIPSVFKDARYGRTQIQLALRELHDQAQSALSILEASGKTIPQGVLDGFAAFNVYPDSRRQQDPVVQLRQDPGAIGDNELKSLLHWRSSLPLADQRILEAERKRRQALEREQP